MANVTSLLFDTETTGPTSLNDPSKDANSKLLQVFAGLYNYDTEEQYVKLDSEGNLIGITIKPTCLISLIVDQGIEVPVGAYNVHGINLDKQKTFGVNTDGLTYVFSDMVNKADNIVAHNINFDIGIMNHFIYSELGSLKDLDLRNKEKICTMELLTQACKLPGIKGTYKWPKLVEAYKWMFGKTFDNAHDAAADTLACAEIYFGYRYLKSIGKV